MGSQFPPSPKPARPHGVLFVCSDNARLSLIAEAMFRDRRIPGARAFSAGIDAAEDADTFVISALSLAGLGAGLWPKSWEWFSLTDQPIIDTVIIFGDDVAARLPRTLPGSPDYLVWRLAGDTEDASGHLGVWRDMQRIRPLIAGLISDIGMMREFSVAHSGIDPVRPIIV